MSVAAASLHRSRDACESNVRVRPSDLNPQTSRSSSSFVNTRVGSSASLTRSSYSFEASRTRRPAALTQRVGRSIAISPASTRSPTRGATRRSTARIRASSSS